MIRFPGAFVGEADERTAMVPSARLVLHAIAGPLRGHGFSFDGQPMTIGRSGQSTIAIPSSGVSRTHARIEYADGGYWLIPEHTVNGSRLNSELVDAPARLSDGDRISISDSTFAVECRDPAREWLELDRDLGELAPPPEAIAPVRPSMAGRLTAPSIYVEPGAMQTPIPAPAKRPWIWWLAGGVAGVAAIALIVVLTVHLVQPGPVPATPAVVTMVPTPTPTPVVVAKPTPPAPAPAPAPAPPPAPPASIVGTLALDKIEIAAGSRGTISDVVRVGTAVARGGAIAHQRAYTAAFEQARAHLLALQHQYGSSPDYADFVEQARQDYLRAARARPLREIASPNGGKVVKVAVKPGQEAIDTTVVAQLAVARITVPVAAVDGDGKRCTVELAGKTGKLAGELLPVGENERTLELDRVPDKLAPGPLGEVRVHCKDPSRP
ncbi:MAG TPA: FHA domain-containing protein [Kofleriaceae bacterium]|jgi:biotin carboxyl carrier protein